MRNTLRMMEAAKGTLPVDLKELAHCIDECTDCGLTCTICAQDCLQEPHVADLARCIALNTQCAEACRATAGMLVHAQVEASQVRRQVELCAAICRACAQECGRMQDMEHCRICAESCTRCADQCERVVGIVMV